MRNGVRAAVCADLAVDDLVSGTKTTARDARLTSSCNDLVDVHGAGSSSGLLPGHVKPPSRQAATLSGWPSISRGQAQHRVVRRSLGPAEHERARGDDARDDRGRGRSEAAAVRNVVGAHHLETRAAGRRARRTSRGRPARPGVARRAGTSSAPSPATSTSRPRLGDADDDVVVQRKGETEAVEARAEVGAGRGHPHPRRARPGRTTPALARSADPRCRGGQHSASARDRSTGCRARRRSPSRGP